MRPFPGGHRAELAMGKQSARALRPQARWQGVGRLGPRCQALAGLAGGRPVRRR